MATAQLCTFCLSLFFLVNSSTAFPGVISDEEAEIRGAEAEALGAIVQALPNKEYGELLEILAKTGQDNKLLPLLGDKFKNQINDLLTDDEKKKLLNDINEDDLTAVDTRDKSQIPPEDVAAIVTKMSVPKQVNIFAGLPKATQIKFSKTLPNKLVGEGVKGLPNEILEEYIKDIPKNEIDELKQESTPAR